MQWSPPPSRRAGGRSRRRDGGRREGGREGGKRRPRPSFACPSVGRSPSLHGSDLRCSLFLSFALPFPASLGERHDETTEGEPGLREWAEGRARLRGSTRPNHGPATLRPRPCVVNERDCPPEVRRAVDAAERGLDAASTASLAERVMGDGIWLLSSPEGACYSHCARALNRKHGKENRSTGSLLERQCILPLLHISGPLGQENTARARQMPFTSRSAYPMHVSTHVLC